MTSEYVRFTAGDAHLAEAILASTVMSVIWEPVGVSPVLRSMVDGGVRNVSPVGDVLDDDPDEIVIINCGSENASALSRPPANIIEIGGRTLDILLNELFMSDMNEFLRINHLVQEAAAQRVTLHSTNGRPLKYFECKIIEPDAPLGDTLDCSQQAVQQSLRAGLERARQVLGC